MEGIKSALEDYLLGGGGMADLIQIQEHNSLYTGMHGVIVVSEVEGNTLGCSFTKLKGTARQFALASGARKSQRALKTRWLAILCIQHNGVL